jgi:multidrug efflux pump subunit AcrA (membrane-fusion protein)
MKELVFATGSIQALDSYVLTAQTDGILHDLLIREGDDVASNQYVGSIDNPSNDAQLVSIQDQLAVDELNASESSPLLQELIEDQLLYERNLRLWESKSISQVEFERSKLSKESSESNLKALQQRYKQIQLQAQNTLSNLRASAVTQGKTASFNKIQTISSGRVIQLFKKKGDYVKRGEAVAVISDMQSLVARINIDEASFGKIQLNQTVQIKLNSNGSEVITGSISCIYPLFDTKSQSFLVDVTIPNQSFSKVIGTRLEANIEMGTKENVLVIPRSYLSFNNEVNVQGKEEKRQIQIGIKSSEWVEVVGGLEEGEVLLPLKK